MEYIEERKAFRAEIPQFDIGYVAIDTTDNHVLDNSIFDNEEDAEALKMEYYHEMPSLVDNSYAVKKVSSEDLGYGEFPYDEQMYLIENTKEKK